MNLRSLWFATLLLAAMACNSQVGCKAGESQSEASTTQCALQIIAAPDGTLVVKGPCPRDGENVSEAIGHANRLIRSSNEISLGRTGFNVNGVFNRCAVMARLSSDQRWTSAITSGAATIPLRDALSAEGLVPSVAAKLAQSNRKLRSVSVESVLLSSGPASDCPKSPSNAPVEANIWLTLDANPLPP